MQARSTILQVRPLAGQRTSSTHSVHISALAANLVLAFLDQL